MSVTNLNDTNNFGEWIIKINEIIELINTTENANSTLENIIKDAQDSGQIGSYLPTVTSRNYNDYVENGVYYIDAYGENGPKENVPHNLYVAASQSGMVTQFAISAESGTSEIFVRSKLTETAKWIAWIKFLTKKDADDTYYPIKGGTINGNATIAGTLTTNGKIIANDIVELHTDMRIYNPEASVIFHNGSGSFQVLVTQSNDPDGEPTLQKPIVIDTANGIASINGTAEYASNLHPSALVQDFENNPDSTKAASGFAISELTKYIKQTYMPLTGGAFSKPVQFDSHIGLSEATVIYSPSDILIHPTSTLAIISESSSAELYLDRNNEPKFEGIPSVVCARTRTGITNFGGGSLVYEHGSLEIAEDFIGIRTRKRNVTMEPPVDEDKNVILILGKDALYTMEDGSISLGTSSFRFSQIYAASDSINTSDENLKEDIELIDDELLDNWKNVQWKSFKFKNSVKKKGNNARIHTGLIAQELIRVVDSVDINSYGFFCHDQWDEQYDTEYVTIPEKRDKDGNIITPEHKEKIVTKKKDAGEQYSLRYQEVQAIENAYLRREIIRLKLELKSIKNQLDLN